MYIDNNPHNFPELLAFAAANLLKIIHFIFRKIKFKPKQETSLNTYNILIYTKTKTSHASALNNSRNLRLFIRQAAYTALYVYRVLIPRPEQQALFPGRTKACSLPSAAFRTLATNHAPTLNYICSTRNRPI